MPIIRNVSWTAENMPDGVTIDKDTGIISGTPAEAGEYNAQVSVVTDYGIDTKDIGIYVEAGSVIYTFTVQAQNAVDIDTKTLFIAIKKQRG